MAKRIIIGSLRSPVAPRQAGMMGLGMNIPTGIFGMWGRVVAAHSEDHSVDVITDRGISDLSNMNPSATRIPVASREWVYATDEYTGGARDLPPEGTYVFILMPEGQIETGFVICSGFPRVSEAMKEELLVKQKEHEALSYREGGWKKTYDKENGDLQIEDDDSFVLIVKKSEKRIDLADWNSNKVVIDENGAKITDKSSNEITMDGSGIVVKDKNGNKVELAAGGTTITTTQGKITGGVLTVNGSAAPTGVGPFCALPFCPITGAPHVGPTVTGT